MRIEKAIALVDVTSDPNGDHIVDGNVDRRFAANGVVVAVLELAVTLECANHGLLRDDIDRAAGRRAPIEGSLRPAQHLNAIDVEIGETLLLTTTDECAIDVVGNAKFALAGLIRRGDATNADVRAEAARADVQAGNQVLQIRDVVDACRFQIATTDNRDCRRNFQHALRPL